MDLIKLAIKRPTAIMAAVFMIIAFGVVAMGYNATDALVMSQVVLSIALPVPMIALIIFTSRRDVMGSYVTGPFVRTLSFAGAAAVLGLNFVLLAATFGVPMPFLAG